MRVLFQFTLIVLFFPLAQVWASGLCGIDTANKLVDYYNKNKAEIDLELSLDSSYPLPQPKKPYHKTMAAISGIGTADFQSISPLNADVPGKRNAGLYQGTFKNGEKAFIKVLNKPDANQYLMTEYLSNLDIGPDYKGVMSINGKPAIVTSQIDNAIQFGGSSNSYLYKNSNPNIQKLSIEQKRAIVEQVELYGDILAKNGIESTDIQLMFDTKKNKLYVIDVDAYSKEVKKGESPFKIGREAPFTRIEFNQLAKFMRQEWGLGLKGN